MNARRFATVLSASCATTVFAVGGIAWLVSFVSTGVENTGAKPITDRHLPSINAAAEVASAAKVAALAPAATDNVTVDHSDIASATGPVAATIPRTASDEPQSTYQLASADPSQMLRPETPSVQAAVNIPEPLPEPPKDAVGTIEILDECPVVEICMDRYLWALYLRTPKQDTHKEVERRKVTVRNKKGKKVRVTRTFTRLVDENFTWKDPKAAEKVGMSMMDYVIGGMEKSFKQKLFYALRAAEVAGLSPGITSAFRDDYRQSIASGQKAATDRSYHGGSFRGGYGHGLAADIVSVKGANRAERWVSTEALWKWVDSHEREFGIGRPYLDRDPPHVGPIDGKEYVDRRGTKDQQDAKADVKKRQSVAAK